MSTTAPAMPKPVAKKESRLVKLWKKANPARTFLAWVFILHGTLALLADFTSMRDPFIIRDVVQWWHNGQHFARWLGSLWHDKPKVTVG